MPVFTNNTTSRVNHLWSAGNSQRVSCSTSGSEFVHRMDTEPGRRERGDDREGQEDRQREQQHLPERRVDRFAAEDSLEDQHYEAEDHQRHDRGEQESERQSRPEADPRGSIDPRRTRLGRGTDQALVSHWTLWSTLRRRVDSPRRERSARGPDGSDRPPPSGADGAS